MTKSEEAYQAPVEDAVKAVAAKVTRGRPELVRRWVDFDLGDIDVQLEEYSDGLFTLRINGEEPPVVMNAEQTGRLVEQVARLGRAKGWIGEADGS